MWQWSNHLYEAARAAGRGVLQVNLDETHVVLRQRPRRGNAVVVTTRCRRRRVPVENASTADRRAGFTYVAMFCNDSAVQPLLPQVIICGDRLLTRAHHAAFLRNAPPSVHVLRT